MEELKPEQKKKLEGALKIMTPDELKFMARDMEWIVKARDQREQNWEFFDGLNFTKDYYLNRKASNTYLRPKKNDDEVRVNAGTVEKKLEVVHSELMSMYFDHEVRAFDQDDNELNELGEDIADVVRRTNQIERDDDLWSKAIWELLTQRAVFLQERFEKTIVKDFGRKNRVKVMPKKELISGLKVFLGDISIPDYEFGKQPYYITYDRIHKVQTEKLYGHLTNFKHTKAGVGSLEAYTGAFDFRLGIIDQDEYEVLTIKSYPEDYCQLYLNGVPMYKFNSEESKLPYEYEGYDIGMFSLRGMSLDFAYGKSLTASAKVISALSDESLRAIVRKWRQSIEPPLAVSGSKKYSRDIFEAGAMTYGLKKDDFSKIIDNDGISNSDVAMYNLITQKTEEFIGAGNLQQGLQSGADTATETLEMQKNFIKSLGFAIFAVKRMKRDMTYLRIYNILENMTSPVGKELDPLTNKVKDIYERFTLSESSIEGRTGKKVIDFSDQSLNRDQLYQLKDKEDKEEKKGNLVRYKIINVKKLLEIPLTWFVNIVQSNPPGSALDKIMFKDKMAQAMPISQIAGQPLNGDKLIEDFERTWNANDWFSKNVVPPMTNQMGQGQGGQSQMGSQLKQGAMFPTQKPSVNNLANA